MSATLAGLFSLSKPKAEAKRRPRRPEEPGWKITKIMASSAFAIMFGLACSSAFNILGQDKKDIKAQDALDFVIYAATSYRAGRNLIQTFKAAAESGDYKAKADMGISQPPPITSVNLSTRECYNVYSQLIIGLGLINLNTPLFSLATTPFAGAYLFLRNKGTHVEYDRGHLRPKWLRQMTGGNGP